MIIYSEDVVLQILKKIREHGLIRAAFEYRAVKYDGKVATEQDILDMVVKKLGMIKEATIEETSHRQRMEDMPLAKMKLSITTTTTYKDGRWSVEIDRPKEGDEPRLIDEDYKG